MKEASLYQKLKDKKVKCSLCNHRCLILPQKTGICGVRLNKNGKLYSLVYGRPIAVHIDPIEKKPLYHFMKGSITLSLGTFGCNFRCDWCQNWEISQLNKTNIKLIDKLSAKLTPEDLIKEAKRHQCPSISYTYTEPTIFFEYALDTMKLAHKNKLKNIWVTNGYFTEEAYKLFAPYLDALNVDLKGIDEKIYQKYCGAKLKPVLDNLIRISAKGRSASGGKNTGRIHLEITTLIIPGVNDDEKGLKKLANFIAKKIGKNTPWHLSRFFGAYKMGEGKPTPLDSLKKAERIALDAGLKYVYLGNI